MGYSDSSRNETGDVRGGTKKELAGSVVHIARGSKNEGRADDDAKVLSLFN